MLLHNVTILEFMSSHHHQQLRINVDIDQSAYPSCSMCNDDCQQEDDITPFSPTSPPYSPIAKHEYDEVSNKTVLSSEQETILHEQTTQEDGSIFNVSTNESVTPSSSISPSRSSHKRKYQSQYSHISIVIPTLVILSTSNPTVDEPSCWFGSLDYTYSPEEAYESIFDAFISWYNEYYINNKIVTNAFVYPSSARPEEFTEESLLLYFERVQSEISFVIRFQVKQELVELSDDIIVVS